MKRLALLVVLSTVFAAIGFGQAKDPYFQDPSWNGIVAQAKKEGKVVWYNWYFQPQFRTFTKKFTEKYGIEVVIPDGTHDGNLNKFLAERKRKAGDIDVLSFGGGNTYRMNLPEFFLGPLNTYLPATNKLKFSIEGGNSQGYAAAFWGNQSGLAYNPAMIKEADLPQTLEKLAQWMDKNPKKLGFNVENGGAGPAFIETIARLTSPAVDFEEGDSSKEKAEGLSPTWKWFGDRKAQFVITASNADSLTRLNDGEFAIVSAWEDMLAGLQNSNTVDKKIKFYLPAFGMPGGGNLAGVAANAPHKAAALLFVQWLTSAETQAQLNKEFGSAPQHPDANSDAALIPMKQRQFTKTWVAKPFGDDIKKAFAENVLLK